ncbi:MAG: c-type cytochrome [Alphaproteobacteria bacterium]
MKGHALAVVVGALALASAAFAQSDVGPPRWMANIARHQQVLMTGVPRPYSAMRDTTPDTPAKLRQGAILFDRECAGCHGIGGEGTGPDAFALVPAPADLNWLARAPADKAQPYMYWTIAESGEAFGSEMPGYKGSLSEKDIWALIAYIRAGYPQ